MKKTITLQNAHQEGVFSAKEAKQHLAASVRNLANRALAPFGLSLSDYVIHSKEERRETLAAISALLIPLCPMLFVWPTLYFSIRTWIDNESKTRK